MKTVCAWCGTHMRGELEDPEVSHGMCQACAADPKNCADPARINDTFTFGPPSSLEEHIKLLTQPMEDYD